MKINDVINLNANLGEAYRILMRKVPNLTDDEKTVKKAIDGALELCQYIYENTDVCGESKND